MKFLKPIEDSEGVFYSVYHSNADGRDIYEVRTSANVRVGGAYYTAGNSCLDGCGILTKWQRRGIASCLYGIIEEHQNIELSPSAALTAMGKAFWEQRLKNENRTTGVV
jgi:hypothetical protein